MILLADGPAAGETLPAARLPAFLRVVRTPDAGWHALDQVGAEPESHEEVWVYRLAGAGTETATYAAVSPQPDEQVLRDTARWQAWAAAELARERAAPPPAVRLWARVYYRARRANLTFAQAEVIYFREHGRWPGRHLPLMPAAAADWYSKVALVPPDRLIPEPRSGKS